MAPAVEQLGAARRRRLRADRRWEDADQGQLREVLGEPGLHADEPVQSEPEQQLHPLQLDQSDAPKLNAQGLPIYEGRSSSGAVCLGDRRARRLHARRQPASDLENQYTPQASVFFEREMAANFGVRTGFVWNGVRNQRATSQHQPAVRRLQLSRSASRTPDLDGRVGTRRRRRARFTAYNLDPAYLALPVVQEIRNGYCATATTTRGRSRRPNGSRTAGRCWPASRTCGAARVSNGIATPNALINTTRRPRHLQRVAGAAVVDSRCLARGIELTPIFRGQAGRPFAPTFIARLNYNSGVSIKAAPRDRTRLTTCTCSMCAPESVQSRAGRAFAGSSTSTTSSIRTRSRR